MLLDCSLPPLPTITWKYIDWDTGKPRNFTIQSCIKLSTFPVNYYNNIVVSDSSFNGKDSGSYIATNACKLVCKCGCS